MQRRQFLESLPKGGTCAEIGVWQGDFSQMIVDIVQPETLYLIDPWERNNDETNYTSTVTRSQAELDLIYEGVVARFAGNESVVVLRNAGIDSARIFAYDRQQVDWAYIDAIHKYYHVFSDCMSWWPLVKDRLCGHDYDKPEVRKAVNEFADAQRVTVGVIGNNWWLKKA